MNSERWHVILQLTQTLLLLGILTILVTNRPTAPDVWTEANSHRHILLVSDPRMDYAPYGWPGARDALNRGYVENRGLSVIVKNDLYSAPIPVCIAKPMLGPGGQWMCSGGTVR